jgi:hypothetical protein
MKKKKKLVHNLSIKPYKNNFFLFRHPSLTSHDYYFWIKHNLQVKMRTIFSPLKFIFFYETLYEQVIKKWKKKFQFIEL